MIAFPLHTIRDVHYPMQIDYLDDKLEMRQKIGLLIVLIIAGILMNLSCFTGLISSDDLGYYGYARKVAEGNYSLEHHHYAIRFGILLPVALMYKVLGVSEWTTILVPFVSSVLSVPLIVIIGWRLFGYTAGMIGGILFASFPLQLHFSTVLIPETVANFYILLAIVFYVTRSENFEVPFSILSGVFIGIAYLTKEPSLFVIVALSIDTLMKKEWKRLFALIGGCAAVMACEHLYYLYASGDLFFRSNAMGVHNESPMAVAANENLLYRLVITYPKMMIFPDYTFGLHSLFAIMLSFISIKFYKLKKTLFIFLWAIIPWLYLNFGSSSFSEYFALPVQPRYILFIYSPLFILAGAVLSRSFLRWNFRFATLNVLFIGGLVLSGLVCGYLTKGQFFHADHAQALKLIVNKAEEAEIKNYIVLPDEDKSRWQRTIEILSDSMHLNDTTKEKTLIIRKGDLGLPEAGLQIRNDS